MSQRWLALDRLRALAVLLMVQGHTFTALMRPEELTGAAGRLHSVIHGLTAPMFLFGAGLAFGVTTYPQYDEHRSHPALLKKRMGRYLTLLIIGYAMQLPGASIALVLSRQGEQLAPFFKVGPLHLIALTLGLCQLTVRRIASPRAHVAVTLALSALVMGVSPAVYASELSRDLGYGFGSWIDRRHGSFFPIFPWASFALLGVAAGGVVALRRKLLPAPGVAAIGAALATGAWALYQLRLVTVDAAFWNTSPVYVLFRLGLVVLALGLLHRARDGVVGVQQAFGRSITATLARHSLVAYVVHLLILYGTPLTPNVHSRLGRGLSLEQASVAAALVLAITLAVTLAWDWMSRERAVTFRWVRVALAVGCVVVLVR